MSRNILLVILGLLFSLDVFAKDYSPGFDCSSKNLSVIENLICSDEELSKKDFQMNQLYILAIEKSKNKDKLKKSQRNWIKNIRNRCTTITCLKSVYESQEIFLGAIGISDEKYEITSEYRGLTEKKTSWKTNNNDELLREMNTVFAYKDDINFTIFSCDSVWENHTGRVNHGWGGICWAEINGNLNEYFMCSNAITTNYSPVIIRNEYLLVRFLTRYCWGG